MSKYIKYEEAIAEIKTIIWNADMDMSETARVYEELEHLPTILPTIEVSEDCISRLRDYQIEWLTAHCDIELEPKLEQLIIRFLNDTTEMFSKEYAPSVVPTVRKNRQVERAEGEWLHKRMPHDSYYITGQCSICKERSRINNYCPWCGAKMKG